MNQKQKLLAQIEVFIELHDMPATTFGLLAVNNGHLVHNLRSGKTIRLDTVDKVLDFMESYSPEKKVKTAA